MIWIILILSCNLAFAQAYLLPAYDKIEEQCYFCGKSIFKYVEHKEPSFYNNMGFYSWDSFPRVDDDEEIYEYNYQIKMNLCKVCFDKYSEFIKKEVGKVWSEIREDLISENECKRERYDEQRKQNKLDGLQRQIDKLNKEKKNLELGIKEESEDVHWFIFKDRGADSLISGTVLSIDTASFIGWER